MQLLAELVASALLQTHRPLAPSALVRDMGSQEGRFELHRHYLDGIDRPTKWLAGVDEAGHFCTAAAKEYPAAMSKGLAYAVVKTLASRVAKSHRCIECTQLDDLFKWVDGMRAASNVIRDDAVVMPDYQC